MSPINHSENASLFSKVTKDTMWASNDLNQESIWSPYTKSTPLSTKTWSLPKAHSQPPGLEYLKPQVTKSSINTSYAKLSALERALEEELLYASALYRLKAAHLRQRIVKLSSDLGTESPLDASTCSSPHSELVTDPEVETETPIPSNEYKNDLCMSFASTGHCHYRTPSNESLISVPSLETSSVSSSEAPPKSIVLYKTEMCDSFSTTGACPYNEKCKFAHGESELRKIPRHPKFKSTPCRNFAATGTCPYGKRCCFLHEVNA